MEVSSLARSQKLCEHVWEWGRTLALERLSGYTSLGCLPQGAATWKWVFVIAAPQIDMDKSTADDHEVFDDTDRELQDLAILKVQWASYAGSAGS